MNPYHDGNGKRIIISSGGIRFPGNVGGLVFDEEMYYEGFNKGDPKTGLGWGINQTAEDITFIDEYGRTYVAGDIRLEGYINSVTTQCFATLEQAVGAFLSQFPYGWRGAEIIFDSYAKVVISFGKAVTDGHHSPKAKVGNDGGHVERLEQFPERLMGQFYHRQRHDEERVETRHKLLASISEEQEQYMQELGMRI